MRATLLLQAPVNLVFDPLFSFGFVSFDIDIIDEGPQVAQRINVLEQFIRVVSDLLFVSILEFKLLLVEVAKPIHAELHAVVV